MEVLLFWVVAFAMLVFALSLFVIPFWRQKRQLHSTNDLNVELFKQQQGDLSLQYQNGDLTHLAYQQAVIELQQSLLADTAKLAALKSANNGVLLVLFVALTVSVMSVGVYQLLGNQQWVQKDNVLTAQQHQSIPAMVERLAQRLKQQPDDIQGWALLARSYVNFRQYEQASYAYSHLYRLVGDDVTLLVDYADVLVMEASADSLVLAEQLLEKALLQQSDHKYGLWVMGNVLYKQQRYEQALSYLKQAQHQFNIAGLSETALNEQIVKIKLLLSSPQG